jgi:hypothetical protein
MPVKPGPGEPGSEDITTEIPAVAANPRQRTERDIYQRRRDAAAAALVAAGSLMIWSQIGDAAAAIFGR